MKAIDLQNALQALGISPEQVRQTLSSQGISGGRGKRWSCPIAKYLRRATGELVRADTYTARNGNSSVKADMPNAVSLFIQNFDGEQYPELCTRVV